MVKRRAVSGLLPDGHAAAPARPSVNNIHGTDMAPDTPPDTPRVLISDKMSPRAAEIFRQHGVDADVEPGMTPAELQGVIGNYDGLAVRSATRVTGEILDAAARLRVIGRAGIGVDNIDIDAATSKGVLVMNTPFGNSITTAEHAIALMFALARQIPAADLSTQAGKWEKSRFMGVELTGKVLGIVGCGNIGSIVADRARGLRMQVIACDPFLSPQRAREMGVEKLELDDLLRRADFISLHMTLTDGTRHLIDAAAIGRMKPGVRIVNCARGGLIDEAALKTALDDGHVAGAALDVFETEPAKDSPVFGSDRVVATPHLGASTEEAQENVAVQVAEQIADYLLNGTVTNPINMPAVSAEEAFRLRPYIELARQLGSFAGQITESPLVDVKIRYEGQAAQLNTRPVTASLLTGLLAPLYEGINPVNAPYLARERNIVVAEETDERVTDYQTRIHLAITTEKRRRSIAGTLVHGDQPRIVEIEGIQMEAALSNVVLFVRNRDKPGTIGSLGKALADAGVNIATFHLGRSEPGGDAMALLSADGDITEPVLMQLCTLPHVKQVKVLRF